jgi:hypothetical protein
MKCQLMREGSLAGAAWVQQPAIMPAHAASSARTHLQQLAARVVIHLHQVKHSLHTLGSARLRQLPADVRQLHVHWVALPHGLRHHLAHLHGCSGDSRGQQRREQQSEACAAAAAAAAAAPDHACKVQLHAMQLFLPLLPPQPFPAHLRGRG